MYKKETLDLYEGLLEKCTPKVAFVSKEPIKTAASMPKGGFLDDIVAKLKGLGGGGDDIKGLDDFLKKTTTQGGQTSPGLAGTLRENLPGLIGQNQPSVAPWLLGGAGAAGLGSYQVGKQVQGGQNEWDKAKYLMGGAALGLSAPVIYNMLRGGGLTNLGARLGGGQPSYADFTSL